jgi:hypothetical protein
MPTAIVAALLHGLRVLLMARLGLMVAKVLGFFGLTFVTNKYAVGPLLAQVEGFIAQAGQAGQFGAVAMQWAGLMRFDDALSMVISALGMAFTIKQARVALGIAG